MRPRDIFKITKGDINEDLRMKDPVYRKHKQKQTILENAKKMVQKAIDLKAEQQYDSVESISLDSLSETEDISQPKDDLKSGKFALTKLHTQHGPIELPVGLLDSGIDQIFDPAIMNKFMDRFNPEDVNRLRKISGSNKDFQTIVTELCDQATEFQSQKNTMNYIHKNPFEVIQRCVEDDVYSKSNQQFLKCQSKANILRKQQELEDKIKYLESVDHNKFDTEQHGSREENLQALDDTEKHIHRLMTQNKSIPEDEVVNQLLLDSISDSSSNSEQESIDVDKDESEEDDIKPKFKKFSKGFQFLTDLESEPLNQLVKRLHDEERQLNREEKRMKEEKILKERKIQETLESEVNMEESKLHNESKIGDWKDEISEEVSNDFRQRCQERLKKDDNLNWIAYSERFKNLRLIKNMQTIKKPSRAWIQ